MVLEITLQIIIIPILYLLVGSGIAWLLGEFNIQRLPWELVGSILLWPIILIGACIYTLQEFLPIKKKIKVDKKIKGDKKMLKLKNKMLRGIS